MCFVTGHEVGPVVTLFSHGEPESAVTCCLPGCHADSQE